MSVDWSDQEVELIVADYFSMLIDELKGIKVNKSQHRHALVRMLNNRTPASVEFKHRNISAVLIEMGLPFIKGYKPLYNTQKSMLVAKIRNYTNAHRNIDNVFYEFANDDAGDVRGVQFNNWVVPAPPPSIVAPEKGAASRKPVKVNYIEKEQNNRDLGAKGEELAIAYEKYLLTSSGKEALADKVEWISRDQGDGTGFDILSRNLNGTDKYIEVKTTKLSKETPFFFTFNEYSFSIEKEKDFHLYRIFNFNTGSQMFKLNGRYDRFCHMEPVQYRGRI